MNKKIISALLIISLVFVNGCGKKKENNNDEIIDNKTNIQEETKIKIIDLDSNSRPYAVVINNFPSAVKVQTGLSDAYMIYEIPVEGGMSRSLAFYKDKTTSKIGTVRSARHNFLDYVMENDAIFAHFGWSHYAEDQIPQLGINNIDGNYADPDGFWRENPEGLDWEHTAYGSLEKIINIAKNKGYRTTTDNKGVLNYSVDEIDLSEKYGQVVNNVIIPYSDYYGVSFVYNNETKRYDRYVNGVPHTDYFTGEHYSTKNIIVVKLDFTYTDDNYYLNLYNTGNGDGYYITNGYEVPITWEKTDRSSKTIYKYLDGNEIKVNDGNTYIMLQSINMPLILN